MSGDMNGLFFADSLSESCCPNLNMLINDVEGADNTNVLLTLLFVPADVLFSDSFNSNMPTTLKLLTWGYFFKCYRMILSFRHPRYFKVEE